jgi:hypothetical protein
MRPARQVAAQQAHVLLDSTGGGGVAILENMHNVHAVRL